MKICLINPASNFNYDFETMKMKNRYSSGSYNYVHLGLAYIASYLESYGYEVDILECEKYGITFDDIHKLIEKNRYEVIGISTIYQNLKNVLRIAKIVKKVDPNIFIYLGGYGATFSFEPILKQSKDINLCMLGEGEITTLALIQALEKQEDWKNIKGIAYLEVNRIVVTEKRELIQDLDVLPFPKRLYAHEAGVAQIVASRGCYGKCIYCGIQEFFSYNSGTCLRRRSAENVFEEIQELVTNQQIKHIVFCDPNFALNGANNRKWVETFYALLKKANFKIHFDVDMRANEVVGNEDLLLKLREVGLETILIGVENFSQKELNFLEKSISWESNVQAIKIIQKLGIKYVPGILLFNPLTTLDDILFNLRKIKSLDLRTNNTVVKPITAYGAIISSPGLTIHKFIKDNGYYKGNERGYVFANKDVELCFEILQHWNQMMPPEILKYRTLDIAADEFGLIDLKNELKEIYSRIYETDLDVFITLVEGIKNKRYSKLSDTFHYLNTYIDWFSSIQVQLINIFNVAERFWKEK